VLQAVAVCVAAGVPGITVHPRADERHIRKADVYGIAEMLKDSREVEYNIEGDPRPGLVELVLKVRPTQCTLVPVKPGEITSQAGWPPETPVEELGSIVSSMKKAGVRVSIFVDPVPDAVRWAAAVGGDRVELYTEPFARAFEAGRGEESFETYAAAAALAHSLGLGVNAGHDLDLNNLALFRRLPHLGEVSIGHALISHALFVGLDRSVRDYLDALTAKT
jgi:pyridoxine 5-phosphate synthase